MKKDLRCKGCGACCVRSFPFMHVVLTNTDLERISDDDVLLEDGVKLLKYDPDTLRCIHLNGDNECSIYDDRPADCRNFEPVGKICEILIDKSLELEEYDGGADICKYLDTPICCHPTKDAGEVTEDYCINCKDREAG